MESDFDFLHSAREAVELSRQPLVRFPVSSHLPAKPMHQPQPRLAQIDSYADQNLEFRE